MESEYYATQNLYEAAFLLAKGCELNGKDESTQKTTVFIEGENVKALAKDYYNRGVVEARAFTDSYRMLKDYIFTR